jgi:hypothetical protein
MSGAHLEWERTARRAEETIRALRERLKRADHPLAMNEGGTADADKEERALDALLVSLLRLQDDGGEPDVEHLPELTAKEKAALDMLGPDFIKRLIAKEAKHQRGG